MNRPTFFLSSTIYDFSDLRSAVKFFLEQQGCIVLASECNDFTKKLDIHSYQACLETISKANYFVLFIGSRIGGLFNESERISITQREYREAYELHKQGKLKIISFVRSEIWNLKEDRNSLSKYLDSIDEISPDLKKKITNHPGKAISDAEFIIKFIEEVSKNKETKISLLEAKPFPTGNWIHIFKEFKDVFDVLQSQIFLGKPIEEALIRKLLHRELSEILKICLTRCVDRKICSPKETIQNFHKEHTLTSEMKYAPCISVKVILWDKMCSFSIHLLSVRLHPIILPQALSSGVFLKFDAKTGFFVEEPVFEALYRLNEEISLFELANTSNTMKVVYENSPKKRKSRGENIDINSMDLWIFLHLMDRWSNIIELCKAILIYLDGNNFVFPQLRGRGVSNPTASPIEF